MYVKVRQTRHVVYDMSTTFTTKHDTSDQVWCLNDSFTTCRMRQKCDICDIKRQTRHVVYDKTATLASKYDKHDMSFTTKVRHVRQSTTNTT
jgi:hypothetical protein